MLNETPRNAVTAGITRLLDRFEEEEKMGWLRLKERRNQNKLASI